MGGSGGGRLEEDTWRIYRGAMEEIGCGGGYGVGRGDEGGGWSRIKDEITRIERVEHNTTIGHIVTNEDGIKDFKVFIF